MKRMVVLVCLCTGITQFAADQSGDSPQKNNRSSRELSSSSGHHSSQSGSPEDGGKLLILHESPPQTGFLNQIYNAPGAILRSINTYNDETLQRQMFGFDEHEDCEEHKRTLECRDYFRTILPTILSVTKFNDEMVSRKEKRMTIWGRLAGRIMFERGQNQIGDMHSSHTLLRIERLLECDRDFGSEGFCIALKQCQQRIRNNLRVFASADDGDDDTNEAT